MSHYIIAFPLLLAMLYLVPTTAGQSIHGFHLLVMLGIIRNPDNNQQNRSITYTLCLLQMPLPLVAMLHI